MRNFKTGQSTKEITQLLVYIFEEMARNHGIINLTKMSIIAGESSSSIGCSWPQGMNCVQGEVQMLQILRWHCRTRHDRAKNAKRRKCKWYKVPYPVTASCKCACSNI